jgi:hypothetical protein
MSINLDPNVNAAGYVAERAAIDLDPIPRSDPYPTIDDLYLELGETNDTVHADLENNRLPADIAQMNNDAINSAVVWLNLILAGESAVFPLEVTNADTFTALRLIGRKYAAGELLNKREEQQGKEPGKVTAGDGKIAKAKELMDLLIKAGLPGVTVTGPAGTFTMDAPIAVAATVDANGCDLPACDPCVPYYSRWN